MERGYEFKDLSILSDEEKRDEILNYFGEINVPYNKLNIAEFIYNYSKSIGRNLYYYITDIILNYFEENDLSVANIRLIEQVYIWTRKMYNIKDKDNFIYYKLFDFCRKYNLYGRFDAKQLVFGMKYLYMYCGHDNLRLSYDAKTISKILDSVSDDFDAKILISNTKHFDKIQDTFRYLLEDNYPNNNKGIVKTIFNCLKGVKQHQKLHFENLNEDNPVKFISTTTLDALYCMSYIYEKLLLNIQEKEYLEEGEKRFADLFVTELSNVYAQHPRALLNKEMIYNFDELLKFLKSDNISVEDRFSDDELKEFLMNNVRSVLGVDTDINSMKEKFNIAKDIIDYANIDADEKVSIKNLLNTHNSKMIYSHIDTVKEQAKLLMGEPLGVAYGEDKDPLSEHEYRYYLRILEMKELFSDVTIGNITPERLNKLIREDPIALNNVRCSVIQMELNKMISCLFDLFGLDDGDIYYTNDKMNILNDALGIDVKSLITLDNIPYLCNNRVVANMRKDDHDNIWYDFCENVKTLNLYFYPSDIVAMIKYHPQVIFCDHNAVQNFIRDYSPTKLFNGLDINPNFNLY